MMPGSRRRNDQGEGMPVTMKDVGCAKNAPGHHWGPPAFADDRTVDRENVDGLLAWLDE